MGAAVFSLLSVAAVVLGVAGLVTLGLGLRNLRRARRSAHWPVTRGQVLISRVVSRTGEEEGAERLFSAEVRYAYEAKGVQLESTRVSFSDVGSTLERRAAEVVARYPAGREIEVRYDPATPTEAVLETSSSALLPAVGAALVAVALSMWAAVSLLLHR